MSNKIDKLGGDIVLVVVEAKMNQIEKYVEKQN